MHVFLARETGGAPMWLLLAVPLALILCAMFVLHGADRPDESQAAGPTACTRASGPSRSSAPIALPKQPKLLVFGDSYTEGYAAASSRDGYAAVIGRSLGWQTDIQGVSGTGYTYGGPEGLDYRTRLRKYIRTTRFKPDVIVLEGSQNDYRSVGTITSAVVSDVRLLCKAFPRAAIVLFGPAAPQPLMSRLGPIDAAVEAAADRFGLPYISPFREGWLTTANSARYGISDGAHLNTAGHAYLAARFLADFKPLLGRSTVDP